MNAETITARDLHIKPASELAELRCKRCHKLLLKYQAHYTGRQIEIVCTKCKYKNIVLI
jgi:phage FluMu protein Com